MVQHTRSGAAVRWLGRFCLERRDATLAETQEAVAAFSTRAHDRERAFAVLRDLSDL